MTKPQQPSPYDVLKRWPLATLALSALSLAGDAKHSDDGREPGRGMPLDNERYDMDYCYEKLLRHMTRALDDPDATEGFATEVDGLPEEIAILWHAAQAAEAKLASMGFDVAELIELGTVHSPDDETPMTQTIVSVGGYCYGRRLSDGFWYGGYLETLGPSTILVKWVEPKAVTSLIPGCIAMVDTDSLTTEKPA